MTITRRSALKALGGGLATAAVLPMLHADPAQAATTYGKVSIPKLRLNKPIYPGTTNAVLNKGGFGHWRGSALPGAVGHSVLFAHRTSAGGPLRNAHLLKPGDKFVAAGITYTVRRIEIIGSKEVRKALTYGSAGRRMSLITCTKPNGLPTSTKYRLIVRATG